MLHTTTLDHPLVKRLLVGVGEAHRTVGRTWNELRRMIATPIFLSYCSSHGKNVTVEQVPYVTNPCRIELGDDVHLEGQIIILGGGSSATLQVGDGAVIGDRTTFGLARHIEIGAGARIGEYCYIADTEGHSHYAPNRPIWEVPASEEDIEPVVIEQDATIGRKCTLLKGVRVGARTRVLDCSLLRRSVPADAVVMGNPARVVSRKK